MTEPTPLDDVEFLSRSPHRVRVLETLSTEARTRAEIHEATTIPQATLGRILDDFQDRGWVAKCGREFTLTPFGALLATEFAGLLSTVETVQRFAAVARHLPVEEFTFDLRLLREATVTVPRAPDVFAHVRRTEELVGDAARLRWLTGNVFLDAIPQQRDLVFERNQTQEVVIAGDALDVALSNPDTARVVRELLETEKLAVYRYDGDVPTALGIVDDVAVLVPYDDQGMPCALVETENVTVRSWVAGTLDDYRDRATRVLATDLSE